jgi:hypothetical protein
VSKVIFETIEPHRTDYFDLVDQMQAKAVDGFFFGGTPKRQA